MNEPTEEEHMAWSVSQLIAFLQRCDEVAVVVLSNDAYGFSYSPLRRAATTYYHADTSFSGTVDDKATDQVPVVALWPFN